MAELSFGELNRNDPRLVEQYERCLFRAFYHKDDEDPTGDIIWRTDRTQRRISTKIPYVDQTILVATIEDAIVAAVSINTNMGGVLQLEMLGFSIDKAQPGTCEGLALFSHQVFQGVSPVALMLKDYGLQWFKTNGYRKIYGTCNARNARGYKILGWEVVDKRVFGAHTEYLITQDV